MPYVVQRSQSVQYTGSNVESLQEVINGSDYWQNSTRTITETQVKWQASEDDKIKVPVGGYLIYNEYNGSFQGMSAEEYEGMFREIS
jgi:hypothetical protein